MNFFNHGLARISTDGESRRLVAPIVNRLYRRLATGRQRALPGATGSPKNRRFHYFKLNRASTNFAVRTVCGLTIRDTADCQSALRPSGTTGNSPAFQRWEARMARVGVPAGTAENGGKTNRLFRPSGAGEIFSDAHPPLKRWAIFGCPSGTGKVAPIVNRLYRRLATGRQRALPGATGSDRKSVV